MTDYRSLSKDKLLAALGQADRTPDLDLIRACLERREELTPALLKALEGGPDLDWGDDDPRWFLEIHAGLLLCVYREPAALRVFGRVFRDPERDNILEWFTFDLPAAYGPLAIPMLLALLNDDHAYSYARSTAMAMLVVVAQDHPEERERIVAAFRSLLPALAEDGTLPPGTQDWEQWTWIALSLADLKDEESQPQVLALYRAGLIDETVMGNEKQYLDYLNQERNQPPRQNDVLEVYKDCTSKRPARPSGRRRLPSKPACRGKTHAWRPSKQNENVKCVRELRKHPARRQTPLRSGPRSGETIRAGAAAAKSTSTATGDRTGGDDETQSQGRYGRAGHRSELGLIRMELLPGSRNGQGHRHR